MTSIARPPVYRAIAQRALSRLRPPRPRVNFEQSDRHSWYAEPLLVRRLIPSLAFGACATAMFAGLLAISINSLDFLRLPIAALMTVTLALLVLHIRGETGAWDRGTVALAVLGLAGTIFLWVWPEYLYGYEINGIVHRSLFTSFLFLAIGLPGLCNALYWVLGGQPSAWDTSRYPIVIFPVALVLFIYGAMLWHVVVEGAPGLSWDIVTQAYDRDAAEPGLRNYILGTLLLVAMTGAFALPVGVGAGICMAEYGGWVSTIVGFCTQMLRAISVFILGVLAFSIADWSANYPPGDIRSDLFRGFHVEQVGVQSAKLAGHGSFLTAALVLALLVIPVIARSTEEGFRSIPREIREGSTAMGATEGHSFLFLLMPWALPNIITGLVLGCAEAAGSVAILLFVAGAGDFGVGPLREATSLGFMIYFADRGYDTPYINLMEQYRFTAALLLLFITFGLSIMAVVLKQKFGARYRGAISNQ